jgi:hypothetical protein
LRAIGPPQPYPNGASDVLELLFAGIGKRRLDPSNGMLLNTAGNRYAAGRRQSFEPRRDVDAVAKDIVALDDHVAKMNADPIADCGPGRRRGSARKHLRLDGNRAANRIDRRGKLDQHAVAGRFEDAPVKAPDRRSDHLVPKRLHARQSTCFIGLHQPRIADNIGSQYCCKPAVYALLGHRNAASGLIGQEDTTGWTGTSL